MEPFRITAVGDLSHSYCIKQNCCDMHSTAHFKESSCRPTDHWGWEHHMVIRYNGRKKPSPEETSIEQIHIWCHSNVIKRVFAAESIATVLVPDVSLLFYRKFLQNLHCRRRLM